MATTRTWFTRWREAAGNLKRDIVALYFAVLDPRTPWYAKAFAIMIVAYAISPIDLIPDPIPILGYLDDLILLPIGIVFALRLIPPAVMADARQKATTQRRIDAPIGLIAAAAIFVFYVIVIFWIVRMITRKPQ